MEDIAGPKFGSDVESIVQNGTNLSFFCAHTGSILYIYTAMSSSASCLSSNLYISMSKFKSETVPLSKFCT